jgi:hypothetical protein
MATSGFSETLVKIYNTTRRQITQDNSIKIAVWYVYMKTGLGCLKDDCSTDIWQVIA